ncbi:MAG: NADH-quinone oxidoreductase subunit D [Planctomycetota bacterium]|nr:NADH-quinone oxidoreductase subunit D [Planctomycetota bacterium]
MTTEIQGVKLDDSGERSAPVLPRDIVTDELVFNMGPQHPSTHGVLRVVLRTDGEVVLDAQPLVGNLHRSCEKILENLTYVQGLPYVDRMDYLGAINMELGLVLSVEKAAAIEVPKRAQYLRVIMCEINRVISHLFAAGQFGLDMGAFTPFLYMFREREDGLTLLNEITGGRLLYHYIRYGGVTRDASEEWCKKCLAWVANVESHMSEYNNLLTYNHIFLNRTCGVAMIDRETVLKYGATGPILRGAGVNRDLRKDMPYSSYEDFDFEVPVAPFEHGVAGDSWNRHRQRLLEAEQSLKIIRQAIEKMPDGEVQHKKVTRGWKAPPGEAYVASEAPRGEISCYFVSDGGRYPYRARMRGPSFYNISLLTETSRGLLIGDLIALMGSIDITLGECDR